ncbi:MAG: thioredoxin family protein [Ignavibacteria bacterium]|nr:thioredoxin family protein [Ignavibacteria bacterium]
MSKSTLIIGLSKSITEIIILTILIVFTSCQTKNDNKNNLKSEIKYIVYYFHPTARCKECLNIESFIRELIETKYKNKGFEFISLNIDEKENEHFKKDFQLSFSSIVIVENNSDKEKQWIKLDSIWSFTEDKEKFFSYTEKEINNFINQNTNPYGN